MCRYGWQESHEKLKVSSSWSEFDGTVYEYRNPLTGGPIMPPIGEQLQLLKPNEESKTPRHTGSVIYQVASGHGWSEIGDRRFEWEEKDIFAIPAWTRYRHSASSEAVLFSFNDFSAMRALALYREGKN